MRITGIRLDRLRVPLDPPFPAAWDPDPRTSFAVTIVRVETDEGVVGIGSGDTMDGFEAFESLFIGQDPLAIARHVRSLETIDFHAGRYWPLGRGPLRRRERRDPGLRVVRDAAPGRRAGGVGAAPARRGVPSVEDPRG